MTGIGPVEPYEPADDHTLAPHPADIVASSNSPRPYEHWAALPPRRRRLLIAGLAAAAITSGALLIPGPDTPAPPPAAPWPSQITHLHYEGRDGSSFRFTARVDGDTPVTIHHISLTEPQLTISTTPRPPVTVTPHTPRTLTVRIDEPNCSAAARPLNLAYFDLTLENRRGREQHSFIYAGTYPHALSTQLARRCSPHELTQQ
ncbi:hypothetical protein [Streptomyces fractus]|uniref:hypothetical protein n=1 Tax=Streptomyces fractus TaxID=641806 RepID=UPI003CF1F707